MHIQLYVKVTGVNPEVVIQAKITTEISVFDLLKGSKVCSVAQINLYGLVSDFLLLLFYI